MLRNKFIMLTSCFLLISFFHDAFADHDDDCEKHKGKYLTPVNNETFIQEWALPTSAMTTKYQVLYFLT
jgi:hypothetical protein